MDDEQERQRVIARAITAQGEEPEGRLGLYRRLIQGNLARVARRLLPRTAAALDAAPSGGFDASFAGFLAARGPRTPYLRDIAGEYVAWATQGWERAGVSPPWLPDLARHEADLFEVECAPSGPSAEGLAEVTRGRPLVFLRAARCARYAYTVDDENPAHAELLVLLHRDADHVVQTTRLTPFAFELALRLLRGEALEQALHSACATLGLAPSGRAPEVVELLAMLGEKGALLGAMP